MAQLLVSVRDAAEALAAVRGGAALIDLKEPRHGALGAVEPHLAQQIRRAVREVAPEIPLSLALGELGEPAVCERAQAAAGFQFAKVGLAGVRRHDNWRQRWREVVEALPGTVRPVAVLYADDLAAGSPAPTDVLAQAVELECAAVLVDTYGKDGRSLFDHQTPATVRDWVETAKSHGMLAVLGGSLTEASLPLAVTLGADVIAVRGAACRGGRAGVVDESLVRGLVQSLVAVVRSMSTPSEVVPTAPATTP